MSLIFTNIMTIGLVLANIYGTYMFFTCFEIEKNAALRNYLSNYTLACIFFFIFTILADIWLIFRVYSVDGYLELSGGLILMGLLCANIILIDFIHPYYELLDSSISILLYLQILNQFLSIPAIYTVKLN